MHGRGCMTTSSHAYIQCRGGTGLEFTDRTVIPCTQREAAGKALAESHEGRTVSNRGELVSRMLWLLDGIVE